MFTDSVSTTGDGVFAAFETPTRAIECAPAIGDALEGVAVHAAARVAYLAVAGEVLVSSTVKDLVAGSDVAVGIRYNRS